MSVFSRSHRGQMSDSMLTAAFIILSGGLQDAYTYLCRGKVYANAQTGNIVLLSTHLCNGEWAAAGRYLVPVLAFMAGIFAAECFHRRFRRMERVHWRQMILLAEIVLLAAVLRKFVLLLPLIYLLPRLLANQTMAVYTAEPVADAIAVTCTAILFSVQFRKALRKLEEPAP